MPDDKLPFVNGGAHGGVGHLINTTRAAVCPHCGADASHFHVENYDPIWMDGDEMRAGQRRRGSATGDTAGAGA